MWPANWGFISNNFLTVDIFKTLITGWLILSWWPLNRWLLNRGSIVVYGSTLASALCYSYIYYQQIYIARTDELKAGVNSPCSIYHNYCMALRFSSQSCKFSKIPLSCNSLKGQWHEENKAEYKRFVESLTAEIKHFDISNESYRLNTSTTFSAS